MGGSGFSKSFLKLNLLNKKPCIATKYPPLSAKCSGLKMKNDHPEGQHAFFYDWSSIKTFYYYNIVVNNGRWK